MYRVCVYTINAYYIHVNNIYSTNLLIAGPCRKAPVTKEFCTDHYWYGPNKCSPEYCRWVFNHTAAASISGKRRRNSFSGSARRLASKRERFPPKFTHLPSTACATRTLTRSRWTRSAIPSWALKFEQSTNMWSQGKTQNQRSQGVRRRQQGKSLVKNSWRRCLEVRLSQEQSFAG